MQTFKLLFNNIPDGGSGDALTSKTLVVLVVTHPGTTLLYNVTTREKPANAGTNAATRQHDGII